MINIGHQQKKQHVYVTGLPRSGSTLLCQLLAQHPDIFCDGMTSPLFGMIEGMRGGLASNEAFLASLDSNFKENYERIHNVYKSIISGWMDGISNCPISVDKNRGWIRGIEFLHKIDPEFKMIVTIRDLGQLFSSVERAHRNTILLGYRDGLAHHSADSRAVSLFSETGVIGGPLKSIRDFMTEINDPDILDRVYYVAYEALINYPIETINQVYKHIGAVPYNIDPGNIIVFPQESDSHYGMKWPHKTKNYIDKLEHHNVLPDIESVLKDKYSWYYHSFYSK